MAVEKLVTYQVPPSSIIELLAHALIGEGFSLVELDRKNGFISATIASPKFVQNITVTIFSLTEGSLVRVLCTARSETSVPGLESEGFDGGVAFDGSCRKELVRILTQVGDWRDVSREWAEEHGVQFERPQSTQQGAQSRLVKFGLFGGLAAAVLGSLLAYLSLSDRVRIASPQVWIMAAVIGVFIFCAALFSLVWRR